MVLHLVTPRSSSEKNTVPFFVEAVQAGFPSPAQGYEKQELNLHEYCVKHPSATYFLRVSGNSMDDARIHHGDVLVVDRSLTPVHGNIVIASIDNEFTVKRLVLKPRPCLMPMNLAYSPIYLDPDSDVLEIWGVVTYSIMGHSLCSE